MSFSRPVTIAGWVMLVLGFATAYIAARTSRGRFPTGVAILHTAMSHVAVRIFALAVWAWVGWHFFVRTSR